MGYESNDQDGSDLDGFPISIHRRVTSNQYPIEPSINYKQITADVGFEPNTQHTTDILPI